MSDFFRYPHIPHIAWLAKGEPRDDKVLSSTDVHAILAGEVVLEEKLDGANIGLSLSADGNIRVQNRGQYLTEPYATQFSRLPVWLAQHGNKITAELPSDLILFGEWCAARHSLDYSALPDWFILFDVYDRGCGKFWSTCRRNAMAVRIGLAVVPILSRSKVTITDLEVLLTTQSSRYRVGPIEGIIIRRESVDWCEARAKLVRADFTQAIGEHWRNRFVEWNKVTGWGGS